MFHVLIDVLALEAIRGCSRGDEIRIRGYSTVLLPPECSTDYGYPLTGSAVPDKRPPVSRPVGGELNAGASSLPGTRCTGISRRWLHCPLDADAKGSRSSLVRCRAPIMLLGHGWITGWGNDGAATDGLPSVGALLGLSLVSTLAAMTVWLDFNPDDFETTDFNAVRAERQLALAAAYRSS